MHIYYLRRYVTLGRPPPLSQSVTPGRSLPRERYVIFERPHACKTVQKLPNLLDNYTKDQFKFNLNQHSISTE